MSEALTAPPPPAAAPVEATPVAAAPVVPQAEAASAQTTNTAPALKESDFATAKDFETAKEAQQAQLNAEAMGPLGEDDMKIKNILSAETAGKTGGEGLQLAAGSAALDVISSQYSREAESLRNEKVSFSQKRKFMEKFRLLFKEARNHATKTGERIRRMKADKDPIRRATGYDYEIELKNLNMLNNQERIANLTAANGRPDISPSNKNANERIIKKLQELEEQTKQEVEKLTHEREQIKNDDSSVIDNQVHAMARNFVGDPRSLSTEDRALLAKSPLKFIQSRIQDAMGNPKAAEAMLDSMQQMKMINSSLERNNLRKLMALDGSEVENSQDKRNKLLMKGGLSIALLMFIIGKLAAKGAESGHPGAPGASPQ